MKKGLKIAVITVSDKGYRGEREDRSGKYIQEYFTEKGWNITEYAIVPDELDMIREKLIEICDTEKANLILTTGGTGFSQRDVTPEATEEVIERKVPGFSEIIRMEGQKKTPKGYPFTRDKRDQEEDTYNKPSGKYKGCQGQSGADLQTSSSWTGYPCRQGC